MLKILFLLVGLKEKFDFDLGFGLDFKAGVARGREWANCVLEREREE